MDGAEPTTSLERPPSAARWEHFAHDADIGVRGRGPTLAAAFTQAALALTAIVTDPGSIAARTEVRVSCEAPDSALLFVDWLNRIISEMSAGGLLFGEFDVETDGRTLHAVLRGEPVDIARHEPRVEPKGATYTALAVERNADDEWIAQCVVDV